MYTNPPSVLKYRPVLTANLRAAARLSNLVLFCQKIWLTAAAQKLDPGQQNIFGLMEVAAEERTEIYKLVTYEFHTVKIRMIPAIHHLCTFPPFACPLL